ncbi:MAG TPA: helical backbone metal receptor [Aquabacterium sp.]|nr:helical backbone metal receptor [Aquabacterium sp.]
MARRLMQWLLAWLMAGAALPALATVTVTDDRGQPLTLPRPAQRIVSLLPSLTEGLCALDACGRLVGVDRFSNWPAQVRQLPQLGGLEDTTIERLVRLQPDLVVAAVSARALGRLQALGIPVLALEPKSLADTRRVLEVLAQAVGKPGQGERLWAQIDQGVSAAAARVPVALRGQAVYFEVASAPYAAGASSFVGELLTRLQMGNVVPAALGPFPKLNPEFVLRAQPAIVMASARAVAEMPARPGWSGLRALQAGRSCGFAEARYEMLVRPGPRLAEAAGVIADCLVQLDGKKP